MRPFQFMIACRDVVDLKTLAERARWAESIGCSHIATHDHLAPQHALIPLLTAVAKATQRLRLCQLVLNNDLRHPAVLAQELPSLDVLSGGRVEVGIGAGWNEPEYRATGLAFDPAGTRIERLTEAIAVLRGLFADGPKGMSRVRPPAWPAFLPSPHSVRENTHHPGGRSGTRRIQKVERAMQPSLIAATPGATRGADEDPPWARDGVYVCAPGHARFCG
jgi:alkanesulfonate monooxygenase SsuD/methylene tetrahydromethanopterin reductase-like flavin-dependent oxidoreductase (luciferase family)